MEEIALALFPVHSIWTDAVAEGMSTQKRPLFTSKKLEEAVIYIEDKKAPAPNGIPSEVF